VIAGEDRPDAPRVRRQRIGAYGIAHDADGRILLVRAASYLTVAGMWFLPGGGVEHGETPSEALEREVREETGLLIRAHSLLGVLSDTWPIPDGTLLHTIRLIYRIDEWSGMLASEADGSSDHSAWFSSAALESVRLVRYVREALDRFTGTAVHRGHA
jgi:8-oxo-dGTP diphosphatase